MKNRRGGFSLIEVMVVCAIMGFLASVASPRYSRYRANSIRTEGRIKINALKAAMDTFFAEYGVYATCWGNMGVEFNGGYYGINSLAGVQNTGPYTTGDTIARAKGAICPEAVSGALVAGVRSFPITKWGGGCQAIYSAVNYGFIAYTSSASDVYVNIGGFWRTCVSNAFKDFEWFFLSGNPVTGLSVSANAANYTDGGAQSYAFRE